MKLLFGLFFFLLTVIELDGENSLKNVFVIWRHGDRAPYNAYLNMSSYFPNGLTELTDLGIFQQYKLGVFLREEYKDFIPDHYHYSHYHLRSSDIDRALMSGQANAAGFYANDFSPLTNVSLQWRPIPIHTVSKEKEYLFVHNSCPKLSELIASDFKTADGKKFLKKFKSTIDKIEKNLGRVFKPNDYNSFHDELVCLKAHNATLPEWVDNQVQDDLKLISEHFWALRFSGQEKLTLQSGVFFRVLMNHINQLVTNGTSTISIDGYSRELAINHIMAFSGHDTNIAAIMSALGVPIPMPDYTSTIMIELHGPQIPGKIEDFSVVIKFKNSFKDTEAITLKLPICQDKMCPLNKLFDYLKSYSIEDDAYLKMCAGQNPPIVPDSKIGGYIAIAAFTLCIIVPAIVAIFYAFHRRRHLHEGYANIED